MPSHGWLSKNVAVWYFNSDPILAQQTPLTTEPSH